MVYKCGLYITFRCLGIQVALDLNRISILYDSNNVIMHYSQ